MDHRIQTTLRGAKRGYAFHAFVINHLRPVRTALESPDAVENGYWIIDHSIIRPYIIGPGRLGTDVSMSVSCAPEGEIDYPI